MPTKKALKKSGKTTKKAAHVAGAKKPTAAGPRVKKLSAKQQKKRSVENLKIAQKRKQLPSAWVLFRQSLKLLYQHKRTFIGIAVIYALFYILFIKGVSANFQLGNLRHNLQATFNGKLGTVNSGVALFGLLLGTAGSSSSESAGVYQTILVILISLAVIWTLRTGYASSNKIRIKDSFYKSTSSLIPFITICLVLVIQLLPGLIVSSMFSSIQSSGYLVGWFQHGVAVAILIAGLAWTLYMLSSTLFAMYIVTLEGAKPWSTLRAAKQLVRFRRIVVVRKIVFLPLILLLFSFVILLPLIIFIPVAAEIVFLIFTILMLPVTHSYLYTLYRSLIND